MTYVNLQWRRGAGVLVVLAALASPALDASTMYRIVELEASAGTAINASGESAGWVRNDRGEVRAVAGSAELPSANESRAFGLNDSGDAVGIRFDAHGNAEAVVWHADGTVAVLGSSAYAMSINGRGDVAGQQDGRAVVWRAGSGAASGLNVNADWSTAMSINDAGTVAGTAQLGSGGAFRAFTASGEGGAPVRMLPTLGGRSSYGQAVNNAGWVAGGSTVANGYLRAFLYTDSGAMLDLGTLGGGNSSAYGVNDAGVAVGYSENAEGDPLAFLWDRGSLVDLNSLIAEGSGWRLTEASAINNAGQIVGRGVLGGVERAFRLDPTMAQAQAQSRPADLLLVTTASLAETSDVPEPGSGLLLALIGIAGVLFGSAARHRQRSASSSE